MKTSLFKAACLSLISGVMFCGCGSSKKITPPKEEKVETSAYYSGTECKNTNKVFRCAGTGESINQSTARNKAIKQARQGLAKTVSSLIASSTDAYVKAGRYYNKEELQNKFESLNREVVGKSLNETTIVCDKTTKTRQGFYKSYVCIEYDSGKLLENINNYASGQEIFNRDFNYDKFKNNFEKELNKITQKRIP